MCLEWIWNVCERFSPHIVEQSQGTISSNFTNLPETFQFGLDNFSLATGISFCENPPVSNVLKWPKNSKEWGAEGRTDFRWKNAFEKQNGCLTDLLSLS